ncbi:MAG: hypothetical protein P8P71_12050, partial [Phycisphaerales bacterium]|nr:hypothetical protein [Phycisphaerales bacterium]
MLAALQSAGFDVGDVLVDSVPSTLRRSRLPGVVRTAGIKRAAASIGRFARRLIPDRSYDSTMEEMRCLAAGVSRKIDAGGFDAV